MKKGLFITFEGNEGSGKTTILHRVVEMFKKEFIDIFITREPGGNKIAEEIRNVILDNKNTEMDSKTEALLYAAARRQHLVQTVMPLLNEGKIVISDRYIDSSLAYQGYARGVGIDDVYKINMFATDNCLPQLTLFFDIDPDTGLERIAENSQREVNRLDNEQIEFHRRVHMGYMLLVDKFKDRFVIVDASKDIETVTQQVYQILKDYILKKWTDC